MSHGSGKILPSGSGFIGGGRKRKIVISEVRRFVIFTLALLLMSYYGLQIPDESEYVEADLILKMVDFSEYENGFRHLQVKANEMKQNDKEKLKKCKTVFATFFNKDDPAFRSRLNSKFARKQEEKPIVFTGQVKVENTNDDKLFTEELIYGGKTQRFESKVPVKLVKPGMTAWADKMESQPKLQNGRLSGYVRIEINQIETRKKSIQKKIGSTTLSVGSVDVASVTTSLTGSEKRDQKSQIPPKTVTLRELKDVFFKIPSLSFFSEEKPIPPPAGFFSPLPVRISTRYLGHSKGSD